MGEALLTVSRLGQLLLDEDCDRVSLDGQRKDEAFVLEHRGRGWLVFFLERGLKRDFRKHDSEDAACRDLLGRLAGRGMWHRTVRIPRHVVALALLAELGEPLVSSTLLLPGQDQPLTEGWVIAERLDHAVDAVIDSGGCGTEPATVIDFSRPEPEIVRHGASDTSGFE